jgi:hypothetical protein
VAHGGQIVDAARRVRDVLTAAGVADIELHPLEIKALLGYREQERAARAMAEHYLALGPLPEHTCTVDEDTELVTVHAECPYGCRINLPRVEIS